MAWSVTGEHHGPLSLSLSYIVALVVVVAVGSGTLGFIVLLVDCFNLLYPEVYSASWFIMAVILKEGGIPGGRNALGKENCIHLLYSHVGFQSPPATPSELVVVPSNPRCLMNVSLAITKNN